MSIEFVPTVACQLSCAYCYQHPMRDAGAGKVKEIDWDKTFEALKKEGDSFTLFGGEALLLSLADLERLWQFGLETFGYNGVQTNGARITDAHIDLFKRYKVGVGISVDGPGDLNDSRWAGSLESTRKATTNTMRAIEQCARAGVVPSIIVTLYNKNVKAGETRERMKAWFRWMDGLGISSARIHLLEVDHPEVARVMRPTPDENIDFLLDIAEFELQLRNLRFDLFKDARNLLVGTDRDATCVWQACDVKTTDAVRGVDGQGNQSNCGRTNKDGVDFLKAATHGYERQLALYRTPQEDGGCEGCRFFMMCKGECPGTGLEGDWRNRTDQCEEWMTLFEYLEEKLEAEGKRPLSRHPKRAQMEQFMLARWARGQRVYIADAVAMLDKDLADALGIQPQVDGHGDTAHGDAHGDSNADPPWTHTDQGTVFGDTSEWQPTKNAHGDSSHGDVEHGDAHGDKPGGLIHADHDDLANPHVEEVHGDHAHGDHADDGSSRRGHADAPHGDKHGDGPHGDNHGDGPHGDIPHGDHNDQSLEQARELLLARGGQPLKPSEKI